MGDFSLVCPCHFGLESVLSGEIKRIGGSEVEAWDGKVSFKGGEEIIAKANLWLRTAERVLIKLSEYKAENFEELFQGMLKIPLEDYIGKKDKFPVKGWSLKSKLHSIPDCQAILKKAAVDRLGRHYKQSWLEETGSIHQIQFSIFKDVVTIMLDTTGPGLHKRGYRKESGIAPIKETLAAGILDLAQVRQRRETDRETKNGNNSNGSNNTEYREDSNNLFDPFCGSGTFLIEGALKALNMPPGMNRRFAFENWGLIPDKIIPDLKSEARENVKESKNFKAFGFDIDNESVKLTILNSKKAGISGNINSAPADIEDFELPENGGTVVCNPPYGERMFELAEAERLYKIMGKVFKPGKGKRYYIISPHETFEEIFGRKADKRRKLYNGMMKCQLYMYFK